MKPISILFVDDNSIFLDIATDFMQIQDRVEHHRRRIWGESELGKGTTFYFTLPVVEER